MFARGTLFAHSAASVPMVDVDGRAVFSLQAVLPVQCPVRPRDDGQIGSWGDAKDREDAHTLIASVSRRNDEENVEHEQP